MKVTYVEACVGHPIVKEISQGNAYPIPRIGEAIRIGERTYGIHNIIWEPDCNNVRIYIL